MKKYFSLIFVWLLSFSLFGQNAIQEAKTALLPIKNVRLNLIPDGALSGWMEKSIGLAETRIPFLTSAQFIAGKDTSRIVSIQNATNLKFYNYVYAGDTTSTASDKDSQVDGYRTKIVGKRLYYMIDVIVTPEQFGAKGDGVTDDYNSINSAITYLEKLPNKNGGVLLLQAPKYELNFKTVTVDSLNIHVVSNALSTLENGTLGYRGKSFAQPFNSVISGIKFEYGSFVHGDSLQGRNGIEISNVNGMRIINCTFNNTNNAIKLVPTGYRQAIKRMVINQCHVLNSNYGIIMPPISDANYAAVPQIGTNKSRRTGGDIKILNFTANSCDYASISIAQCDGLQISDGLMFSPDMLDATGRATKTHNIKLVNCTYTDIINSQLFESGLEGLWIEESDNVKASGLQIAWSGERIVSSGVRVVRKSEVPVNEDGSIDVRNRTLSISIVNSFIENPTLHGIFLDGGSYSSRDYRFTDISLSGLGSKEKYFGDTAQAPKYFDHYSILSDASFRGVIYTGTSDSYYAKQRPKILGSGYYKEFNTFGPFYSEEFIGVPFNTGLAIDEPKNLLENLFPQSNNFASSVFTRTGLEATIDSVVGPQGDRRTAYKLTESGSGNIQHIIYTNTGTGVSLTKVAGDTVPFTFSGYFKPIGRKFFTLIANNSVNSSGIVADFDLESGAVSYAVAGGNNTLFQGNPRIYKAGNGWFKVVMTFTPDAAYGGIRFGMIPKLNIQDVGSRTYTSDGRDDFYVCDWQMSKTTGELPFTNTTGTQKQKTVITYSGGSINSITDPTNEITTVNDGAGNITIGLNKPAIRANHVENRLQGSNQLNSLTYFSSTSTDLGITAVSDTLGPFGKGKIFRIYDKTTTNVQRGIWNNVTVNKSAIDQNFTGSFYAKPGEITSINLRFSTTSGTGSISYDIDLVNHKLIRPAIVSAGTYNYLPVGFEIEKADNGYYRYSATFTSPANAANVRMWVYTKLNSTVVGNLAYAGTVGNKFYMSDWQLSQSDIPLNYVLNVNAVTQNVRPLRWNNVGSLIGVTNQTVVTSDSLGNYTVGTDQNLCLTCTPKFGRLDIGVINGTIGAGLISSSVSASKKFVFQTNSISTIAYGVASNEHFQIDYYDPTGVTATRAFNISNTSGNATIDKELTLGTVPVYADNAAATTAGLAVGKVYRTSTGVLMIRY